MSRLTLRFLFVAIAAGFVVGIVANAISDRRPATSDGGIPFALLGGLQLIVAVLVARGLLDPVWGMSPLGQGLQGVGWLALAAASAGSALPSGGWPLYFGGFVLIAIGMRCERAARFRLPAV